MNKTLEDEGEERDTAIIGYCDYVIAEHLAALMNQCSNCKNEEIVKLSDCHCKERRKQLSLSPFLR